VRPMPGAPVADRGSLSVIVAAAGSSRRMQGAGAKPFLSLRGRPVLAYCLDVFETTPLVDRVILVANAADEGMARCHALVRRFRFRKVVRVVAGGDTRMESVARGLAALEGIEGDGPGLVAVHDAARPFVSHTLLEALARAAARDGAAVPGLPVTDTLKRGGSDSLVAETVDRRDLYRVQTPQVFRGDILRQAYRAAAAESFPATDDAALVERRGLPVTLVPGDPDNIKITTPSDLLRAEAIARRTATPLLAPRVPPGCRAGIGFDVHRLVRGRDLVLGGVRVDHPLGLDGHSDADVVVHAVMDALLGAVGERDIGHHFPDSDPAYADADSLALLRRVLDLVAAAGWEPVNVDTTIAAQRPRLAPHTDAMRHNLATVLDIPPDRVGVKATTTEGLGIVGREGGIAAWAVALLRQRGEAGPDACRG